MVLRAPESGPQATVFSSANRPPDTTLARPPCLSGQRPFVDTGSEAGENNPFRITQSGNSDASQELR